MSYFRSGDPLEDFDRLDRQQARWLSKRPQCSECGEHIQDEKAYYINGEFICNNCISNYEVDVDDYCD